MPTLQHLTSGPESCRPRTRRTAACSLTAHHTQRLTRDAKADSCRVRFVKTQDVSVYARISFDLVRIGLSLASAPRRVRTQKTTRIKAWRALDADATTNASSAKEPGYSAQPLGNKSINIQTGNNDAYPTPGWIRMWNSREKLRRQASHLPTRTRISSSGRAQLGIAQLSCTRQRGDHYCELIPCVFGEEEKAQTPGLGNVTDGHRTMFPSPRARTRAA